MTDDTKQMFSQRYDAQDIPWDTGITPPEIVKVVAELPPGKAIDLGCGTGTNVHYLLQHDWKADGIDFIPQATQAAQLKLADFPPETFSIFCHDVTQLDLLEGLRSPYNLAIDIGCGHGIDSGLQAQYAKDVAALLKPGGTFMLYARQPDDEQPIGWTPDEVQHLFLPYFEIVWQVLSTDTSVGFASGWYRLVKKV